MSSQNCISDPFIFKDLDPSDFKGIFLHPISVETKKSANQHLPMLSDYSFATSYMEKKFEQFASETRDFKVRKDDVWVLSYPKSGTTLLQNVVSQLTYGFDGNRKLMSLSNGIYLEEESWEGFPPERKGEYSSMLQMFENEPSPRIVKSHLPPHLLPLELWTVRPKIVYICRNPKDAAVSMYHMVRNLMGCLQLSIEEYLDDFLDGKTTSGSSLAHNLSFWQLRHLDNFLFLTYEELTSDLFKGVKKVADFLETKWDDEHLAKISEHLAFKNMQKKNQEEIADDGDDFQRTVNRFFRKGKAGGYIDEMSKEYIERFDKWTADCLQGSGLKFEV